MARQISSTRRKQIVQIVNDTLAENAFKRRKIRDRRMRFFGWVTGWSAFIFFSFFGLISTLYHLGAKLEPGVTMLTVMKWSLIGSLILGSILGWVWFDEDEKKRRRGRRVL